MKKKILYMSNVLLALIIGILGTLLYFNYNNKNVEVVSKNLQTVTITETNTIKSAIDKIYDSVVVVEVSSRTSSGTGSGFVYKKENGKGYIITNHHVIEGADTIYVTNSEGVKEEATLLGSDEYSDIAVLSVNDDFVIGVATIGDSTKSELGDTVFTVGSPLGSKYQGTVTKGIISGKDRQVTVSLTNGSFIMEVLQIDAAINPGNSGGPLVNINGEVIGVNSLKLVEDEIEGMGFAIPIELAMSTIDSLERGEKIVRPQIGVEVVDVDSKYLRARSKIKINSDITAGVVIISTVSNYPAEKSGLEAGDVITEVDGVKITDSAHFKYILYKYNVGDTIKVKYIRNDKEKETSIKLSVGIE